jgi:hypothetical protein
MELLRLVQRETHRTQSDVIRRIILQLKSAVYSTEVNAKRRSDTAIALAYRASYCRDRSSYLYRLCRRPV